MSALKGHTSDKTVLVVEDNAANLKLTRDLLQLLECRVVETRRAEDALKVIEGQDVDLVLMDIQLPGMDGLTACRIIREEMGIKDLPIVGVSALAMDGDREKALEAGCCEYITKPIDTRMFMGMVMRCLSTEKCGPAEDKRGTGNGVERRRILVVDDNPTNVKLLKAMLPEDKYEIHEANNGATALKIAAANLPDVIFLDIMMPDMDGYEVTKRLKEKSDTAPIPVVLVTALEGVDDRIRGLEAGAEDVLVKPVNRVEVLARARSMVRLGDFRRQVALREQAAGTLRPDLGDKGVSQERTVARVLAVEDNVHDLDLLQACLAGEPYEILTAGSGEEALAILRETQIDLILLDILLPDMDGFKVLERAKGMKGRSTVQTVVTTCLTDLESKVRGVELGADDYIVKPVNPRELKARLKVLLKKKRYMDQLKYSNMGETDTAFMDALTGVYNRDFFKRFFDLELKRSQRHEYSTSLVKLVIHDLERSGKQRESGTKDTVLREVASTLKVVLRDIDLIARCEDAGFAMLLPYCEETGVVNVVTRIREALAACAFPSRDDLSRGIVSVSFGTATFPGEVGSVEQMAALVEKKLESDRISGGILGSKERLETGPSLRGKV